MVSRSINMKEYFQIPKNCPVCNSKTEIDGKFLICPNDSCPALAIGNLQKWIDVLDIKSIGPSIIDALYEAGKIEDPSDFYKIKTDDISNLERLGERSAKKILKNLHDKKELTVSEFIGGLNMRNFSNNTAESIVNAGYNTIEKMQKLTESELVKIQGIESKTANQVIDGLKSKEKTIKKLLDVGITIVKPKQIKVSSTKLAGFSYCFTGAIQKDNPKTGKRYTREEMQQLVKENGGIVETSVKKGLSCLVLADPSSNSSKVQKAKKIGVNLLSEEKFFEMIL